MRVRKRKKEEKEKRKRVRKREREKEAEQQRYEAVRYEQYPAGHHQQRGIHAGNIYEFGCHRNNRCLFNAVWDTTRLTTVGSMGYGIQPV